MSVKFTNNAIQVKGDMSKAAIAFLLEAGGEVEAQAKRNSRVKTGQTKGSWTHVVDEDKGMVTIGSPNQNAIWEEFGTGEYALKGDGRKGGWFYVDSFGKGHFTHGKTPNRALWRAFETSQEKIINQAKKIFGRL